jgi:DNA-binding HxlR family transcriptional regulator
MNDKTMDCLTNPIKCKLLLEIHAKGQATTKQLSEIYNDIPSATLYRYLKRMTDDGVLKVVEENQIRGTVEKTYALAIDLSEGMKDMLDDNAGEAYMHMFMNYVLGFIKQFQEYCKRPDINIVEDKSGFSLAPIYATDEELERAVMGYAKIIKPLLDNPPAPKRKLRTLGLIVTPPQTHRK